jgi:hypothetical protein
MIVTEETQVGVLGEILFLLLLRPLHASRGSKQPAVVKASKNSLNNGTANFKFTCKAKIFCRTIQTLAKRF